MPLGQKQLTSMSTLEVRFRTLPFIELSQSLKLLTIINRNAQKSTKASSLYVGPTSKDC